MEARVESLFIEIDKVRDNLMELVDTLEGKIRRKRKLNSIIKFETETIEMKNIGFFYNELDDYQ